ncbi:CHAP domain-containing protein [Streptomyces sp. NBC_01242]|uniref:CHAP domain-containing protein n=1 Tax=Streptomyces sp. NBC_01242 TaxID=2903795 RepID=UPI00224D48A9|nr:CHAP domain-containing protein [Streptomyces sp. NBC_01242]MCX4799580.1 CHAP domain-containing protein [Streptomyces sp. NBC_01242]
MTTKINAADVIGKADGQIGYHEGRSSDGHWNNDQKFSKETPGLEWSNLMAWCCTFIVWCAHKAGDKTIVPVTASCISAVNTYRSWKRFSFYPAVGAQVFFGTNGHTHTGIVTRWDSASVWTIEGNTNVTGSPEGDGVYEKKYRRTDPYVYGYGYPKYDHAMDSADPEWSEPGKEPEKPASPAVPAKPKAPAFPGRQYFVLGAKNAYAKQLQTWLHKGNWGPRYLVGPSTKMTSKDLKKVKALQQHYLSALGPADGLTGPLTWQYAWEVANGYRKK